MRRMLPFVVTTVVLALLAIGGTYTVLSVVLSDAWSRGRLDLVSSFTKREPNPSWPYLNAKDRTAQVCAPPVNCVQAVGNEYLNLLKFKTVDDARRYTETLGTNGRQIDPLVVHFNGEPLSPSVQDDIVSTLSRINASSPD